MLHIQIRGMPQERATNLRALLFERLEEETNFANEVTIGIVSEDIQDLRRTAQDCLFIIGESRKKINIIRNLANRLDQHIYHIPAQSHFPGII